MKNPVKIASVILFSAWFTACSPDVANKYTFTTNRFGTIFLRDGKAGLSIDLDADISFDNFSTEADMRRFNVSNGDRVLAKIYIEQSKNTIYELLSAEKLIMSYPTYAIPQNADSYFRFQYTQIDKDFVYGEVWSNGHYINCGLVAMTSAKDNTDIHYYLYPDTVDRDTLYLRLYASIPNPCVGKNAVSRLLTFDMSSLTRAVNNTEQDMHRTRIADALKLKAIKSSSIAVKISTADSTKITDDEGKLIYVPSFNRKTTLSLDFLRD